MSGSIKLTTPGSGSVSLTPASSIVSDVTVNVPSQNCTLGIQGPAFSAYRSGTNQSISTATFTKVQFNSESFDTNNNFDSTTNYRFTPTIAGYYQINVILQYGAASGLGPVYAGLYKNGSQTVVTPTPTMYSTSNNINRCWLIYMNGTTDYLEVYAYADSGTSVNIGAADFYTVFSGALVRAA